MPPDPLDNERITALLADGDQTASNGQAPSSTQRTSWTAAELMAAEFPPPKWAVPGILPEGVTLLAGAPKLGKSWLALHLGLAVASGGHALGKVPVDQGQVLYLALEDTPRRLQGRIGQLLGDEPAPEALHLETQWPPLTDEAAGTSLLHQRLQQLPDVRLVVVDVLAEVRGRPNPQQSVYGDDRDALAPLRWLAEEHSTAVVAVHHTRKAASDDFVNTVSGSHGLGGGCDSVAVLARTRGEADATLSITGRDVDEAAHALSFDAKVGTWTLLGDAAEFALHPTRKALLDALRSHGALRPKQAADLAGIDHETAKKTLQRMDTDRQVDTADGGYYLAPSAADPPGSLVPDVPESPDSPLPGTGGPEGQGGRGGEVL